MDRIARSIFVLLSLVILAGCDIVIRPEEPTPGPTSLPGSACAAVSVGQLQTWMNDKLPRLERGLVGGTVYLDTPKVTNCIENSAHFQVRIGYERPGLLIELALLEDSFGLHYDPARGDVCLDLHALLTSPQLEPQGVEQVGQEIKVAEFKSEVDISLQAMPAEERQQLEQAVGRASIHGDPSVQGIGTEASSILLDWAIGDLLERFNRELARLVGACIAVQ